MLVWRLIARSTKEHFKLHGIFLLFDYEIIVRCTVYIMISIYTQPFTSLIQSLIITHILLIHFNNPWIAAQRPTHLIFN